MSTRSLVPRASGEGGIGTAGLPWGTGNVDDIWIAKDSIVSGNSTIGGNSTVSGNSHVTGDLHVSGSAYFTPGTLYIGNQSIKSADNKLSFSSSTGIMLSGTTGISVDSSGVMRFSASGLKVGNASVMPDPGNPETLYFEKTPQVMDAEGNPTTILTADKLGLGTAAIMETDPGDIKFKLLTDQDRFVVGSTGDPNGLESGWYRFNDFKVKGATDVGAHILNPIDTRIYSDDTSFILFTKDDYGNRVAHLVGGDESVNANNAMALGIAVKFDGTDSPEDIEFVHADGESYSLINGDGDSKGVNGLPIRQGFQPSSIGGCAVPLLIDGGYF